MNNTTDIHAHRILILDFGSQYTQLIARRVREAGVYSEIVPFDKAAEALARATPRAIILSGGPASVHESGTPQAPNTVFNAGVPVLGICYGEQTMVAALGGQPLRVLASAAPELERLTGAAPATFELAEEATLEDPNPN